MSIAPAGDSMEVMEGDVVESVVSTLSTVDLGNNSKLDEKGQDAMEAEDRFVRGKFSSWYYFDNDVQARTTDPEVMKNNYRLPVRYFRRNPARNGVSLAKKFDSKDEMIISPEFAKSLNISQFSDLLEKYGKSRKTPVGTPTRTKRQVIKRACDYSVRFKVVKTKVALKGRDKMEEAMENNKNVLKGVSKLNRNITKKTKILTKKDSDSDHRKNAAVCNNTDNVNDAAKIGSNSVAKGVQLSSLNCLKPSLYLNDEIIDYGMLNAFESSTPPSGALILTIYAWNSFFYLRDRHEWHADRFYKHLCKLAPERNLLKIKYLVFPCIREQHWFLMVICKPFPDEKLVQKMEEESKEKKVPLRLYSRKLYFNWLRGDPTRPGLLLFDSVGEKMEKAKFDLKTFHKASIDSTAEGLLDLHRIFWKNTGRDFTVDSSFQNQITPHFMNVPGQRNAEDCGIYCMNFLKMWLDEMQKKDNDYLALCLGKDEYQMVFQPYQKCYTRKNLFDRIIEECKTRNPRYVGHLLAMKAEFFAAPT